MNQRVKDKALKTLDGMEQIIRNERIVHGEYATEEIDPEFQTQVCSGRQYCLLGAAWASHGARIIPGKSELLEGVAESERKRYLSHRPALKAVYDALNNAAERRLKRGPITDAYGYTYTLEEMQDSYESVAEGYFEDGDPGRSKLIGLVQSARREIEAA